MNTVDSTESPPPPAWLSVGLEDSNKRAAAWPWYVVSIAVLQLVLILILLLLLFLKSSSGGGGDSGAMAASGGGGANGGGQSSGGASESGSPSQSGGSSSEGSSSSARGSGSGEVESQESSGGPVQEEDLREGKKEEKVTAKLQIALSWTAKADLDLYVVCPSGETMSYSNTMTDDLGFFKSDGDTEQVEPKKEVASWPFNVSKGTYVVRIKRDHTGQPDPVDFTVAWVQGGKSGKERSLIERNQEITVAQIHTR